MKTFPFLYQSSSSRNTKETFITYLCDFPQLFFLLASFILEPDPYNSLTEPSHLGQLFLHQSIGTGIGAGGGEDIQTIASSLSNCSLSFFFALYLIQFVGIGLYLQQVLRIFSCFSVKTVLTFPALLLRSLSDAFFRSSSNSPDPNLFS